MNSPTINSFESGVDFLVASSPKNNNKGNLIKKWFLDNFNMHARVSHTTEDRALGNRVSEQFRHKPQVVVFVCKVGLNISSLIEYVKVNAFSELETVLIMSDAKPYTYEQMLVVKENDFSKWVTENLNIEPTGLLTNEPQKETEATTIQNTKATNPSKEKRPLSLQTIIYGAPGTGKSHRISDDENVKVAAKKNLVFRTTFHPDTDYATFVGCYKPKTHKKSMINGNGINETQLLSCFFDSNSPKYKRLNKARYLYEALVHTKDIRDLGLDAQAVADKLNANGFSGCAYTTEATCMYNIYDWLKDDGYIVESKLSYEFAPQCFVKAYVEAWKHQQSGEPVFLIIEEINRGNCAQIFGDLFQLLDRDNNGFSRYEISPDSDLQEYISELGLDIKNITDADGNDISAKIANGELMKLPNNLYIWATMNTSDQSLFPIDSAFKRRWEWEYIKITKPQDKNWELEDGTKWWDFLQKINAIIASMTSSADKQLGYFFCKPDKDNNTISYERFVNKVVFYLWNDVFKDYAMDEGKLFKFIPKDNEGKDLVERDLTYPDFYDDEKGEKQDYVIAQFIQHVMEWQKDNQKA